MKVTVAKGNIQIKYVNARGRFKLPLIKNNPRVMQSGEELFKDVTNKITVLRYKFLSQ
jgi:predicted molibdopterin-dependent oxidoreductase YjgC